MMPYKICHDINPLQFTECGPAYWIRRLLAVAACCLPLPLPSVAFCADVLQPDTRDATSSTDASSGVVFQERIEYPTGQDPFSVAVDDLNGDGKLDLVTANANGNNVSVLLGKRNGTFRPHVDYPTGSSPLSVQIGDLNRDGVPDLASANPSADTVSVLIGKGNGIFNAKVDYGTGDDPWAIQIGDVNRDGKPDLVTANVDGNTVSVLLGRRTGTFRPKVDYPTGGGPLSVQIGDVNRDGIPDLVTANAYVDSVSVLLGRRNGTFKPMVIYPTGHVPTDVQIGDVNRDGIPDLVSANSRATAGCLASASVLLGRGDGTFQNKIDSDLGVCPSGAVIRIGDVNRDGLPDLVAGFNGAITLSMLLGKGDGSFESPVTFGPPGRTNGLVIADINRDGKPDLVVTEGQLNAVGVWINVSE